MHNIQLFHFFPDYRLIRLSIILTLFLCIQVRSQPSANGSDIRSRIHRVSTIIVIAPHPDDEILGFAGVIYYALQMGKAVKVVLLTNGEGYGSSCYFWKNGCPKEDSTCLGSVCSSLESERYGKLRVEESKRALAHIGLAPEDLITLGYPDDFIEDMLKYKDSIFTTASGLKVSASGKSLTGKNLIIDLKDIFKKYHDAVVFTTHIKDYHEDHNAIAAFVQLARVDLAYENILFPVYWGVIHQPGWGDNNSWPPPEGFWEMKTGEAMLLREDRYTPMQKLHPPVGMKEVPEWYFLDEHLWYSGNREKCIMRKAIDEYRTQAGLTGMNDSLPKKEYEGWMDRNGFLLSFVKMNHLFWEAPYPVIEASAKCPCHKVSTLCLPGVWHMGDQVAGFEGSCSCQSEVYCDNGLRIASGLESGKAWYDIGPFFQDSISITMRWTDNSWSPGRKTIEIYNWDNSSREVIAAWDDNSGMEKDLHVSTALKPSQLGALHQVRILMNCSKNARLHVSALKVE
ncbi:MAG: PIG-L family deacetylase [Bacteroidetes bacterium]|nr:PIG-L family deacetylase [Bacteroidota bacterium]